MPKVHLVKIKYLGTCKKRISNFSCTIINKIVPVQFQKTLNIICVSITKLVVTFKVRKIFLYLDTSYTAAECVFFVLF